MFKRLGWMVLSLAVLATPFVVDAAGGATNFLFWFDVITPIDGLTPVPKAALPGGTLVLQLEVKNVNLPNGTPLTVILTQYERTAPYSPLPPVTIGTLTLQKGQVKASIDFTGMLDGYLNGLEVEEADGTLLLHAIPVSRF